MRRSAKPRQNGATPLLIASQEGELSCARLLLEAGAVVNQTDEDGATPLFMACQEGHLECVQLLLKAGAAVKPAAPRGALRAAEVEVDRHHAAAALGLPRSVEQRLRVVARKVGDQRAVVGWRSSSGTANSSDRIIGV